MTPEERVKKQFQQRGETFTDWAEEHGYPRHEVYRVLNGQAKAKYGRAHDIAVALGLKPSVQKRSGQERRLAA